MKKTLLLVVALSLTACASAPIVAERDEAKFVELVRAAGGETAELYTDEELIAEGDALCADAETGGYSMEEFAETAKGMAAAPSGRSPSAALLAAVLVDRAGAHLCPEL